MKRYLKFLAIPAAGAAAIGIGAVAWAYVTSNGTGSASANVATLGAPSAPTVEQIGTSPDVKVTWNLVSSPDGDQTHVGYHILRDGTTDVCGSTFLAPLSGLATPASTMNCTDTDVSVGAHSYTVTTLFATGSWTAVSPPSSVTVNQAPAITSANAATFTVGTPGSFTVTATGFPTPTISETGMLPSGVTLSSAGVLSGTPAVGTGGIYPITITATNTAGTFDQSFTLTVNQAPAITSANATTFTVGTAGSFTVTASGFPTPTLSRTGTLPSGVTFDTATGVLSGTPAAGTAGTYVQAFTAANGVGSNATQTFTLTVNQAPAITSANATTFTVVTAGS
ncbi:MAG: putative Ig domain-containing protein, partial [Acidimicrobiia bacterium]